MKKVIIMIIIGLLMIIPRNVIAAGSITPSTNNLTITKGKTATITITANNAVGRIDISSSNTSIATVDKTSEWIENQSITVIVTGVEIGTTTINVTLSDAATFDEETLTGGYTINVKVNELSTNNNLNNLTIDGKAISNFNPYMFTYGETVENSKTRVNIGAEKSDSKATVEGIGEKILKVGKNTFDIVVTSESGAIKTYTVNITRAAATSNSNNNNNSNNNSSNNTTEDKSNDNTLKTVTISNIDEFTFDSNITTYNLKVKEEIEEVEIKSTLTDTKAKYIEGYEDRKITLVEGENKVEIKVEAENGDIKTYTFNISKEIQEYVKNIRIKNYEINFKSNKTNYEVEIEEEKKLEIEVELLDEENKYEIIGNEELQNGSQIGILIRDKEGKKLKEYIINIKKNEIKEEEKKTDYKIPIVIMGIGIILLIVAIIYRKKFVKK